MPKDPKDVNAIRRLRDLHMIPHDKKMWLGLKQTLPFTTPNDLCTGEMVWSDGSVYNCTGHLGLDQLQSVSMGTTVGADMVFTMEGNGTAEPAMLPTDNFVFACQVDFCPAGAYVPLCALALLLLPVLVY